MWKWVTDNFAWKLLSLLLAFALWLTLVGNPDLVSSVSVPIEFRNMPRNLEIASAIPERVRLDLEGPDGQLRSLASSDIAVLLDLKSIQGAGERTFPVSQWNLNLPSGVTLTRAVPGQLRFRFEPRVTRDFPIQVHFAGDPPDGYQVTGYDMTPNTARLVGPQSRVAAVTMVQTDPIDVSGFMQDKQTRVNVFVNDPQVRIQTGSTISVKVFVGKRR